jgi:DNA sulfur modification protein DndD
MFFRSITLTDFGPFKGEQHIEFPADNGVSIIYGENMRGKTTLLNAIRYALFGRVITRGDKQIALHQIGNWETAQEAGRFGFKVTLAFEHEDSKYELTREHRPGDGVTSPQSDLDYQQHFYLQKDGHVLGPDRQQSELARLMPETVSRFFLFDGELLQQYEELLRNESEMGQRIKEAIERILGVPVLTNARAHLADALKDAQKLEAKAAQRNQRTQMLGNQHEALLQQRDSSQDETDRLKRDLEVLRTTKAAKEDALRKTERTKALLDQRVRLQEELAKVDARLKEKDDRRKLLLKEAWKGLLSARIRATRMVLETEWQAIRDRYSRTLVAAEIGSLIREALEHGQCSTCGQVLSASAIARLGALNSDVSLGEQESLQLGAQRLQVRIEALKLSEKADNADVLQEVQNEIDDLKTARAVTQDYLTEIRDQTKDFDEAEVRKLYSEYDKVTVEIGVVQEGIRRQEDVLRGQNDQIRKIEDEMAKFADAELDKARDRKQLFGKLSSLFTSAVDAYRDRLRTRVEADATILFRKLTSEPEYTGLRINDSYGLTIVHQDGSDIPVRSAGAEHIVALSLMGALQHNAPMRGPIVMDSPFGRLDAAHTAKVVEALPSMANQVMLLAYESELDPQQARDELKGMLRKEYRIVRRSARHSDIEPIV